jgi:beta-phosphoglucomutase
MTIQRLAILWDLDGTIIDSKECHFESWKSVFEKFGFAFSRSAYDENFGRNNHTALRAYLGFEPDDDLETAISDEKEAIFRKTVAKQARLIPGVRTWLEEANARKFPQVIASSAPMENIKTVLTSFELDTYFEHLISGADLPAKPEPDVFLTTASSIGYLPVDCLVIEDSSPGVHAAKNAGMRCIGVASAGNQDNLVSADLVLKDFIYPFVHALRILAIE